MAKKVNAKDRTHPRVTLDCSVSLDRTKQSMMAECDVNGIVGRYAKTGLLTPVTQDHGIYIDVSHMGDYKESLAQVDLANDMFMQLPSGIRAKFDNDPAMFLDYAADEENIETMQELGLMPSQIREETDEPVSVPSVVKEGD